MKTLLRVGTALVCAFLAIGCGNGPSGGNGGQPAGNGGSPGGSGCTGTYSGSVSGNIDCSVTIFIGSDLDLSGTLSGSDVIQSWAFANRFNDAPQAKTYALADMKQVDTQLITNDSMSKTWDLHYDGTGTAPAGYTLTLTDASAPHGTLAATLTNSDDASTVDVNLTF